MGISWDEWVNQWMNGKPAQRRFTDKPVRKQIIRIFRRYCVL